MTFVSIFSWKNDDEEEMSKNCSVVETIVVGLAISRFNGDKMAISTNI